MHNGANLNPMAKYAPPAGSQALADSDSPDVTPQAAQASCSSYDFFKHHGPESRPHCHSTPALHRRQRNVTQPWPPSLARPFQFAKGQVTGRVTSRYGFSDSESGPQGKPGHHASLSATSL
jgi:hypothetical protein